jgi:hypothetical protein
MLYVNYGTPSPDLDVLGELGRDWVREGERSQKLGILELHDEQRRDERHAARRGYK